MWVLTGFQNIKQPDKLNSCTGQHESPVNGTANGGGMQIIYNIELDISCKAIHLANVCYEIMALKARESYSVQRERNVLPCRSLVHLFNNSGCIRNLPRPDRSTKK